MIMRRKIFAITALLVVSSTFFASCSALTDLNQIIDSAIEEVKGTETQQQTDNFGNLIESTDPGMWEERPGESGEPEIPGETGESMDDGWQNPPANNNNNNNNSNSNNNSNNNSGSEGIVLPDSSVDENGMFTGNDKNTNITEAGSTTITLKGTTATSGSSTVKVSSGKVMITTAGTYTVSGTFSGQIVVNAAQTDKVNIILNGVTVNSETSAAIYAYQASKVFITLADGTKNKLTNGGEYVNTDATTTVDAVVFSKTDLTLNGGGSVEIFSEAGHGIVSKDDLVITAGNYDIDVLSHAINGKNSVRIADGKYTLKSTTDGIHAENLDDTTKGFVYIEGGTFNIESDGDGISATNELCVSGGAFNIKSGGGSANGATHVESMPGRPGSSSNNTTTTTEPSAKGLKSETLVLVKGGKFTLDCADDAVHGSNISIENGELAIAAGDDGIHADDTVKISGGKINITKSYEGIEGLNILISGGDTTLVASDDGINGGGGADGSGMTPPGGFGGDSFSSGSATVTISGGTLSVDAGGDGLDSNGTLTISGGYTYLSGPTSGGNGNLDYDSSASITGGTFVCSGNTDMAQNFGTTSTQCSMLVNVSSGKAGDTITLKDSNGNTVVEYTAKKSYACVIISTPELKVGEAYTLTAGSNTTTVNLTSMIYGGGSGMGGGRPTRP